MEAKISSHILLISLCIVFSSLLPRENTSSLTITNNTPSFILLEIRYREVCIDEQTGDTIQSSHVQTQGYRMAQGEQQTITFQPMNNRVADANCYQEIYIKVLINNQIVLQEQIKKLGRYYLVKDKETYKLNLVYE